MTYNQGSKWDNGNFAKRKPITDEDKKAIAQYYQAGRKVGTPVEEILEFLLARYGKSTRQIQRYISEFIKAEKSTGTLAIAEHNTVLPPKPMPEKQDTQPIEKESSEPLSVTSKEPRATTEQENILSCQSPPYNVDIIVLKSWGVPAKKAADILFRWRELHREGSHQMCQAFRTLEDNLKNQKIPFRRAELYLNAELHAREFDIDDALSDLERSRKYRIWERPENLKAFFKESEELRKPMLEARQKHLNDVENLLKGLREAVLDAWETKKYDNLLKMEENPLFESLQRHCWDVYDFFWNLKHNLETLQNLESDTTASEIDKTLGNDKKKELLALQKNTIASIKHLRKAIDYTLNNKSYFKEWCPDCINKLKIEPNPNHTIPTE